MLIKSRREFLRTGLRSVAGLGAIGAMSKFGEMNALAAGANYRALVCIFLAGGNDGHNTVIPIQTAAQNIGLYQTARQSLALPQGSLLAVTTKSNDTYGLHPRLVEIQSLYQQNKAAIVANLGMLVQPTTKTAYNSGGPVPTNLFSHSDQTTAWQTSIPNGISGSGWGGRMADSLAAQNSSAQFPPIVSTGGCGLFCTGVQTLPTTVPPGGAIGLANLGNNPSRMQGVQQLLSFDNGLQLVQAANGVVSRGANYANVLNGLLAGAPALNTPFPANNPLAAQLKMVARIIGVQAQLGLNRQIFFCQLGGFDTHSSQLQAQDALLQQLSQAVGAFYTATQELGADQQVTTFTSSEFGRTLMPNSGGGTDHAWGSHHFVIGGGVQGGDLYGQFPVLALGSQNDATGRGALIPTTSVDQYGATLANWFGVGAGNLATVFPNLAHFNNTNLGFLG